MEKEFELFYQCSGISTDTRKIEKNCLFVCLSGANFNGNTFAQEALKLGAKFVIADEQSVCDNKHIFFVSSSLEFLQKLANYHRKKFDIPVIGITGSNGKTSTKELLACVLNQKYKVLATEGNLNNHIGVPLTLLRLKREHEIAIIEMGANKFKDIEELCDIAEPNYGIITNIGKAHLEGFLSFEGVLKTKRELYEAVSKVMGTLVYNADDSILKEILPKNTTNISYGTIDSHVQGTLVSLSPFVNMEWQCESYQSPLVKTAMIGKYNFYNFLAAITFGKLFNVEEEAINEAISSYNPSNNRSQVKQTQFNTLILDAYNANPTSMKSALESFALIDNPEKLVILGDMFELGKDSSSEHQHIVDLVHQLGIEAIFIGEHFFKKEAQSGKCKFFKNKDLAKEFLTSNLLKNKLILLKGSRGIGLEALVENL